MKYVTSTEGITVDMLSGGFFDGWPNPPSCEIHLQILQRSDFVVLAIDESSSNIAGFISAITDDVLCAYVSLLEVLPRYRNQGIGHELVSKMLALLKDYYMIDLSCDAQLQTFYERHHMSPAFVMVKRNYQRQSGV